VKFLVPNYSCLQNPWLGGCRPQIPRSLWLLSSTEFVEPPRKNFWVEPHRKKFLGTPLPTTCFGHTLGPSSGRSITKDVYIDIYRSLWTNAQMWNTDLVSKTKLVHNFFFVCLFLLSTCFGQLCAHHQEKTAVSMRHLVFVTLRGWPSGGVLIFFAMRILIYKMNYKIQTKFL
jgi:hypothetical protein